METFENEHLPTSMHLSPWEIENPYFSQSGESSDCEEEKTVLSSLIPRDLELKMKKERFYNGEVIEESESEEEELLLHPTKVVIRHLPPGMKKDEFFEFVSSLSAHDYKYFAEADKVSNENVYSTAYINFVNHEDALLFLKQFDGHIFQDNKGEKFEAVVEFAPSQQVPKQLSSRDSISGTVDDDSDYQEFLESLNTKTVDITKESEVEKSASKPIDPLVDFVNKQRAERVASRTYDQRHKKHYQRRPSNTQQWRNYKSKENQDPFFLPNYSSTMARFHCYNNAHTNSYAYYPRYRF